MTVTSTLRSVVVAIAGCICLLFGVIYYALHPDHTWHEMFGEPESFSMENVDDSLRYGNE